MMIGVHARRLMKTKINTIRRWQQTEIVIPLSRIEASIYDRDTIVSNTTSTTTTTAVNHPSHHIDRYRRQTAMTNNRFMRLLLLAASSSSFLPTTASLVVKRGKKVPPPPPSPPNSAEKLLSSEPAFGYYFEHKTVMIPHDKKKDRGGEDAATTSARWLVVADGIGGWASEGINPGDYSRMLTEKIVELGTQDDNKSGGTPLVDIVHQANWMAASEHIGSATCTTLRLTGPTEITTLNIGDSGYSIHRRENGEMKLLFESEPGQRGFNYPYQLGGTDGDVAEEVGVEMTHSDVGPDDVIVVYSDGVSDNLSPSDFHSCLEHAMDDHDENDTATTGSNTKTTKTNIRSLSLAADYIAKKAYFLGKDKTFNSPFAQVAQKAGYEDYQSGKHDDITVVVAQIRAGDVSLFVDRDPYFKESITLYKGPIGQVKDLPKLKDLITPSSD